MAQAALNELGPIEALVLRASHDWHESDSAPSALTPNHADHGVELSTIASGYCEAGKVTMDHRHNSVHLPHQKVG